MSKDTYSPLVVTKNEDVTAASFTYLNGDDIGDYEKQDIVENIYFEAIVTLIKNNFFHWRMDDFLNKLEYSDQKKKLRNCKVLKL